MLPKDPTKIQQYRDKLRLTWLGKHHSIETRRQLRLALLGRRHSTQSKLKMHLAKIGTRHPKFSRPGPLNGNWKGGRSVDVYGYILIRVRGQKIREHRFIVAKYIKRPLLPSEPVHHIDGNPKNNKANNLIAFDSFAAHMCFHRGIDQAEHIIFDGRNI